MCGRIRGKEDPEFLAMMDRLRADVSDLRFKDDLAPGDNISIVLEKDGDRRVELAKWWLLLQLPDLKPSKLTCFNSRYDKLNTPRSLSYVPYRKSRCIIPASAIIEGAGKARKNHMIEQVDRAIACGGLYKTWLDRETGELKHSCSIITLPPVVGWEDIHPKSMPLMLDEENTALIDKWLDPEFHAVEEFDYLLQPFIRHTQRATPIGKVSQWNEERLAEYTATMAVNFRAR